MSNIAVASGRISDYGPKLRILPSGKWELSLTLCCDEPGRDGQVYTTQPWRSAEDRQDALETLKQQLGAATHTLSLPAAGQSATARSKLVLWSEMVRGDLKEWGELTEDMR